MLLMKVNRMKMAKATMSGTRRDYKAICTGKKQILKGCIEWTSNLTMSRLLTPVLMSMTLIIVSSIDLIDVELASPVHGLVSVLLLDHQLISSYINY